VIGGYFLKLASNSPTIVSTGSATVVWANVALLLATHAAVKFAAAVAQQRGHVSDADITAVRSAGYDDAQLVEIIALVAESIFTNYLDEAAEADIDFPVVRADPD
jgi:alkylhydroperoxidase family enzyme